MKINEIISTTKKTVALGKSQAAKQTPVKNARGGMPDGWGAFSRVTNDPTDPGMVHKVNRRSLLKTDPDGSWQWLSHIVDNNLAAGNPCLPRVYEQVIYQDTDREQHRYRMEKLYHHSDFSGEELSGVIDRWVIFPFERDGFYKRLYSEGEYWDMFISIVNRAVSGVNSASEVVRQPLARALDLVVDVAKKNSLDIDLHPNNIMIRPGPGGLTPVITDPLSFKVLAPVDHDNLGFYTDNMDEAFSTKQTASQIDRIPELDSEVLDQADLGQGAFSAVSSRPDDPGVVDKKNWRRMGPGSSIKQDGFWVWAQWIIRTEWAQKNPCFPRIYASNVETDGVNQRRQYEIERLLVPWEVLDREDMYRFIERWVDQEAVDDLTPLSQFDRSSVIPKELWRNFCFFIEKLTKRKSSLDRVQEPFRSALMAARVVSAREEFRMDINMGNVMLRAGPGGLVPVLTDPLSTPERFPLRTPGTGILGKQEQHVT